MSEASSNTQESIDLTDGWVPGDSWGARLAAIRQAMSWNNSDAAKACGLDRQSWQNWEAGAMPRDKEVIAAKIAEATGCNRVWLLTGQRPPGADLRTGSFATPLLSVINGDGDSDEASAPLRGHLRIAN